MEIQTPTESHSSHELPIISLHHLHTHDDNSCCSISSPAESLDEEAGDISQEVNSSSFSGYLLSQFRQELQENFTTEQLLTTIFHWVMGSTSIFHLILGLEVLEKAGVSKSFSPILMSLFKYSLATFTSRSITWAEVRCSPFKIFILRKNRYTCLQGLTLPLAHLFAMVAEQYKGIICYFIDISSMVCLGAFVGQGKRAFLVTFGLYSLLQIMMLPVVIRINSSSQLLLVIPIINTMFRAVGSELQLLTPTPSVLCFLDKGIKKLMPVAAARVNHFLRILKEKNIGKLFRYAVGLVGTIIFQNFFRLTTFDEIKAFLYLATSWLAVLTLIDASEDFGILNFLLGNMILGSTVSQSGLKSTTWFTCGVCLLLYVLRLNFKSVTSPNLETMQRPPYLFWIFYFCTNIESLYCLVLPYMNHESQH